MALGAALRGFGAIMKKVGSKRSPTISSVKPSVHKTKRAQKDARMKELFDKQKSRTLSDRRMGKADGGPITTRDINKNGKKDGFEIARAKGMANGMGRPFKAKDGGSAYHTTKDGRRVKKGLYYYMNRAKKRGTSKPGKGSVTDKALKDSARTAKAKGGWIQSATKGMRKDKPCTGKKFGSKSCPPGSKRYNLAKTFRKMAKDK